MIRLISKIHIYDRFRLPIAILCVFGGIWLWSIRPINEPTKFPRHGEQYLSDSNLLDLGDRSDLCTTLTSTDGYILISGTITANVLDVPTGYLQSADNEEGIFLEYDPGENRLVRMGVRLIDGSTGRLNIRNLSRTGQFQFATILRGDGTARVLSGTVDSTTSLKSFAPSCTNWKVGYANGNPSLENSLDISVSSGWDVKVAEQILEEFMRSDKKNGEQTFYRWPLYAGLIIFACGNPWRFRIRIRRSNS